MPRPFHPTSRAEAIGGTLADIRKAASEDREFLHGLAVILADLTKPAEGDDVRSAWRNAIQTRSHHA